MDYHNVRGQDYTLEVELKTFKTMLPSLLADPTNIGKYAVICMDKLLGIMVAYEDAIKLGYKEVGMTPFLAKRILPVEEVMTLLGTMPRAIPRADPMFESPSEWANNMAKHFD